MCAVPYSEADSAMENEDAGGTDDWTVVRGRGVRWCIGWGLNGDLRRG